MSGLAAVTTILNVTTTYSATTPNSQIYKQLDLFGDVLERVRSDYVEQPDDAKLIETAINGMLSGLDPHSAYLNAKHFQDMQVQTRGEFDQRALAEAVELHAQPALGVDIRGVRGQRIGPAAAAHVIERGEIGRRVMVDHRLARQAADKVAGGG